MILSFISSLVTAPLNFYYYIKWIVTYLAIRVRNLYGKKRFDLYDVSARGDYVKTGFIVPEIERGLESPQSETHLYEGADEIFIYGVNSKNECLLARIARGPNQISDAWIYIKLANGKTYHLSENVGYQQPFDEHCVTFSCGKLQMYYLLPMRRWRIFFCGMLRETSTEKKDSEEMVFVKFVFQWTASSDVYDLSLDTNVKEFTSAIARADWKLPFFPPVAKFSDALNFYAQGGIVKGTVSVSEGEDYEMYLFGEKMRNIGKSANIAGCKFTNILGNIPSNGFNIHLGKACVPHIFNNLSYGFIVQPSGVLETVEKVSFSIKSSQKDTRFEAIFYSSKDYVLKGDVTNDPIVLYSGQGWSGFVELFFIEFKIGNKKGSGIVLSGEVYNQPPKIEKFVPAVPIFNTVPLSVPFAEEVCQLGYVSGGKGSSLGKLTQLSEELKTFVVPKGIVVTTVAYEEFVTPEIISEVKKLEDVLYENIEGDLKQACNSVADVVIKSLLPHKICHSIIHDLKEIFGEDMNSLKFAVRSSATGEDTSTMSAAGQMDTFLGVQGLQEIFIAVKKCWASQFGYIAVEYKKRNGQVLNSAMAVVIQEMVDCEVSGVLFTCDPVTNNPSKITITANYGLGETVVSGSVEPDTIVLRRMPDEGLAVESILLGTKLQKIIMQESGGTSTEDVSEDSQRKCCLSEETILRLGRLAVKIEHFYRSSRDIEFGIKNQNIYMLQSRPVTNVAADTEYEIQHEFDAPLRCENDYISVANVGEVMPGATTPLAIDTIQKFFGNVLQDIAAERGQVNNFMESKYYPTGLLTFCNHIMLTVAEMLNRYGINTPQSKGLMMSIFGRILDDPDLLEFAGERASSQETPPQTLRTRFQGYWDLFFHSYGIEKVKEKLHNYHLNFLKYDTAKETFYALLKSCSDFDESFRRHVLCSETSSNWNSYLFDALWSCKGNFDNDVYSDFASLLSTSSNVESADVPQAMLDLAIQITKDIDNEDFKSMSLKEAETWLQTSMTTAGEKFRTFIKKHGHRCLKEFDVYTITWGMDPKLLVGILQNMVGISLESKTKNDVNYDQLLSDLNVSLNFWSKLLLKFILPNCRKAVRGREAGKSLTIKSIDHWRKGYRRLSKQMYSEGRIPNEDLIFFMVLEEIDELLKTRSPSIIARATNRQRLFPTLENYMFPEIMKGIPKQINEEDENYEFVADLTMKGIPVSQGVAKGFARVAVSLEEARHLKHGEILITYSTDIGWSPYFPIISGVVTELGGLISHGAVVSREYGLPCVVGLQGATKRFQTGDYVLLDGKKGILQRLPQPELSNSS